MPLNIKNNDIHPGHLFSGNIRYDQLINSLPGIFYLYEKNGDHFNLRYWNKNHETVTGYSADELRNKAALDFFQKKEHPLIKANLSKIFTEGKAKQVFAHLKIKDNTLIPYIFEGYRFSLNDRCFFMGVGIDISHYEKERKKLEKITSELSKKERELFSNIIENEKNTSFINHINKKIDVLIGKDDIDEIKQELIKLKSETNYTKVRFENWNYFKSLFNNIHPSFFRNLLEKHPGLSDNDLKFLSFIKLSLTTNQISGLLHITNEGVKKRRYRIKKKLGIHKEISLKMYINSF